MYKCMNTSNHNMHCIPSIVMYNMSLLLSTRAGNSSQNHRKKQQHCSGTKLSDRPNIFPLKLCKTSNSKFHHKRRSNLRALCGVLFASQKNLKFPLEQRKDAPDKKVSLTTIFFVARQPLKTALKLASRINGVPCFPFG